MTATPIPASFRDPAGRLLLYRDRVLRFTTSAGGLDLTAFLGSPVSRKFLESGAVVGTRVVTESELRSLRPDPDIEALVNSASGALVVEHDRIPFPSFL